MEAIEIIRSQFSITGNPTEVPLLRGNGFFTAELVQDGVLVDNLGNQPFLPWVVFQETIALLKGKGGKAERGDAMNFRLGEAGLKLDTIEGHIAYTIYGKSEGESVFRRITPITCILIWAGICRAEPGEVVLISEWKEMPQ